MTLAYKSTYADYAQRSSSTKVKEKTEKEPANPGK